MIRSLEEQLRKEVRLYRGAGWLFPPWPGLPSQVGP